MAGEPPLEAGGKPLGPEAAGGGQPPTIPGPQTREQEVAAQAAAASAPEPGQGESQPEEGLEILRSFNPTLADDVVAPDARIIHETNDTDEVLRPVQPQAEAAQIETAAAQPRAEQVDHEEQIYQTLDRLSEDRLQSRLGVVEQRIASLTRKQDRLSSLSDINAMQDVIESLEAEKEMITEVMERKGIEPKTRDGVGSTTNAERQRVMEDEAREFAAIQKMTPEQITAKKGELEASRDYLDDRSKNAPDPKDRQAAKGAFEKVKGQLAIVEGVAEEKTAKQKLEETTEGREGKTKELEDLQREAADPDQLRANIEDWEGQIKELDDDIDELDEKIGGTKDDDSRAKLEDQKAELTEKLVKLRQTLKKDEEALKAALKKGRETFNPNLRMNADALREMSNPDFIKLAQENPAQTANYLKEVIASTGSGTSGEVNRIALAIQTGQPLSIRERAIYADWMAKDINANGRKNISLEQIAQTQQQYPEMVSFVFDKVAEGNDALKRYKELNPSRFEKIMKFAKNNPHWLLILIAIIAAGGAAIGVAAGPVLGGLAGAGSAAGAGGAGYGIAGRR